LVDIRTFIRAKPPVGGVDFCLPRFGSSLENPAHLWGPPDNSFGYPSATVAERDARSAFHVMSAVGGAVDDKAIAFTEPREFVKHSEGTRTAFIFGSRSNEAVGWLVAHARDPSLVRFKFGKKWTIIARDDKFSISDPSKLTPEEYLSRTDYGVVARLSLRDRPGPAFLIAGLGGRATEGCGIFLARNWAGLQQRFGDKDFAVVLEFPPPVSPESHKPVASYSPQRVPY
jgi:hypothetical protein